MRKAQAIISSDWNECLAPCGPFDFISFTHPDLKDRLETMFRRYTTGAMSLGGAVQALREMLPRPITEDEMDAYLDASFSTYPGLPEWIEWCLSRDILFMINTTGMVGYFQRLFARGLLPAVPVLSAHPMIRFGRLRSDPDLILELFEIQDKPRNSEAAMNAFGIPPHRIIVMGDSGGDGPHFEWGAKVGALLIGSRIKPSLATFCRSRGITIDIQIGDAAGEGSTGAGRRLAGDSFMELKPLIEEFINR